MRGRRLRAWLLRIPLRVRVAVIVGVIAIAGLVWQHYTSIDPTAIHSQQTPAGTSGAAPPVNAVPPDGEFGDTRVGQEPAPTAVPDASVSAARATAERFAVNFASPNGDFDDWFARICTDVSAQLQQQYRLTDIRNLTQAKVQSVVGPLDPLPGTMGFQISYSDGSQVQIRVEMGVEGWKVINVLPMNTPVSPTAPYASPAREGQ